MGRERKRREWERLRRRGWERPHRWWPSVVVALGGSFAVLTLSAMLTPPFPQRRPSLVHDTEGPPAWALRHEVASLRPEAEMQHPEAEMQHPEAEMPSFPAWTEGLAVDEAAVPAVSVAAAPVTTPPASPLPQAPPQATTHAAGQDVSSPAPAAPPPAAAPDASGGGAAPAEPPEPPPVVIHHRTGSTAGRQAARRVAEEARKAGATVRAISPGPAAPSRREVHYIRDEDAAAAERLAARFRGRWGNGWRAVQVEQRPGAVPEEQGLVIWLPHR